jgi:hypothetical protein
MEPPPDELLDADPSSPRGDDTMFRTRAADEHP